MRLTKAQEKALHSVGMEDGATAYTARVKLNTLYALEERGLVRGTRGLGSMAFPQSSIIWRLTPAGRAALAKAEGGDADG